MAEYLSLTEAAARLSISRQLLHRRVLAGQLTVYRDPKNHRVRLLAVADLDRLAAPIPMVPHRREAPERATG